MFYYTPLIDTINSQWKDYDQLVCICGHVSKKPVSGYTNLMAHIKGTHADEWSLTVNDWLEAKKAGQVTGYHSELYKRWPESEKYLFVVEMDYRRQSSILIC